MCSEVYKRIFEDEIVQVSNSHVAVFLSKQSLSGRAGVIIIHPFWVIFVNCIHSLFAFDISVVLFYAMDWGKKGKTPYLPSWR